MRNLFFNHYYFFFAKFFKLFFMRNLNRVTLIGRLGKDPELQRFDSGAVKVNFSLATSESYMDREGIRREITEWHNVVMWRKLAEIAEQYLRKGNLVFLEGKLRTRSWDDQQSVELRSHFEKHVDKLNDKIVLFEEELSRNSVNGDIQHAAYRLRWLAARPNTDS